MLKILLVIGTGSFIGGIARFLTGQLIHTHTSSSFPFGTLAVNIIGCFLIGLLIAMADRGHLVNTELKLFLTVGICGGFTTFSTFSIEGMTLLKGGNVFMFLLYSSLSVIFGLVATWLGYISLRAVQI
jgi:fluoride exporter